MVGDIGPAHPFEVYIDEAIGAGKKAGRLRRSMLPQFNHCSHSGHKQQKAKQNGEATPNSHVSDEEMIAEWLVWRGRLCDFAQGRLSAANSTNCPWKIPADQSEFVASFLSIGVSGGWVFP